MSAKGVEVVAVTVTGAAVGAMIGGPVGLGIGLGIGALIDILILRRRASGVIVVPPGGVPGVPGVNPSGGVPGVPGFVPGVNPSGGLPPGANITAATNVTRLLFVNTPNTVSAAKVQLGQFQASVGLAPTGTLDPQTRAMMVLAYPSAASLPTPTALG